MILVLEIDVRNHGKGRLAGWWRPRFRCGRWGGERVWSIGIGIFRLHKYPSRGIKEFFDYIRLGGACWHDQYPRKEQPSIICPQCGLEYEISEKNLGLECCGQLLVRALVSPRKEESDE